MFSWTVKATLVAIFLVALIPCSSNVSHRQDHNASLLHITKFAPTPAFNPDVDDPASTCPARIIGGTISARGFGTALLSLVATDTYRPWEHTPHFVYVDFCVTDRWKQFVALTTHHRILKQVVVQSIDVRLDMRDARTTQARNNSVALHFEKIYVPTPPSPTTVPFSFP